MGRWLSERLGQSVVIENRPGAGSNIANRSGKRLHDHGVSAEGVTAVRYVHPVSSSQLTQDPDRVRSFGGYNNVSLLGDEWMCGLSACAKKERMT
jgi:hypothetical protein